jgi:hypothetical protein
MIGYILTGVVAGGLGAFIGFRLAVRLVLTHYVVKPKEE